MDYFANCTTTSLWSSDELAPEQHHVDTTDSASAPELQTAALNSLIEDKEIAAEAVAIVIRSSRRGVVALCAEMAELLKANRSLERQVARLTIENKAVRSTNSNTSSQADVCNNSVRSGLTSGYHSRPAVAAEVHHPADRPASNPAFLDMPVDAVSPAPVRRQALPTGSGGGGRLRRRRHRSVQWPLESPQREEDEVASLREDVRTALRANAAVVNELMVCKRELNLLRSSSSEGVNCPLCCSSESPASFDPRPASVPPQRASMPSPAPRPASTAPPHGRVSLLGCACRQCFLLRRQGCPRRLLQLSVMTSNQSLRIKDMVLLTNGRRGCVRYLGHVDTDPAMDATAIWIGIELDAALANGGGDGKIGHKRYFSGQPGCVVFVQLPAIASVELRRASSSTVYISDYI